MKETLVRIVIPTYQRANLLPRAIESALAQTYRNLEVIVVSDNNPVDDYEAKTLLVIENYKKNRHIKYLPGVGGKNGGAFTRNRGLREAKGQYINFLDDDDVMHPTKIEEQIKIVRKDGGDKIAVIGCCAAIVDARGKMLHIEKPIYDKNDIFFSELKSNICTTSLCLFRTDDCLKVGGWDTIESSQEHLFLIKVFAENPSFEYVNKVLVE